MTEEYKERLRELAAVSVGIAEGKPFQFQKSPHEGWLDASTDFMAVARYFGFSYRLRLKPEPAPVVKVPLGPEDGPEDVPVGCAVRYKEQPDIHYAVLRKDKYGVTVWGKAGDWYLVWDELSSFYEKLIPGGQWEPCGKEVLP